MKTKLGKFGAFVKEYEKARRTYSKEVFVLLKSYLGKNSAILDLGCGTGISTRQLAKFGKVIGCDPDPLMLAAATKHKKVSEEKYVVGSSKRLPFGNSTFDVVAAFSAFHWFNDKTSVREIRRVLKPGGLLFVVNKTGLKSWGEGYRKTIIRSIKKDVAKFREDEYNPRKTMVESGFKKVRVVSSKQSEFFSLGNALEYVQSVSIWNSVSVEDRGLALQGLHYYFRRLLEKYGKIERKLTTRVVLGVK